MVDRSQVQVTIDWAKVTHQNRVKRIKSPAQDLATFIGQVKAHFKELAEVDYLYDLETNKLNQNPYKTKFVISWQSQSPLGASILDQSQYAVEINSQDQYLEILCTHAIVDRNNNRISTPRFTVYIKEQQAEFSLTAALGSEGKMKSAEEPATSTVENQVQVLEALNAMSPLLKVDCGDNAALAVSEEIKEEQNQQPQPRNTASELNASVPVSAADDEDYFVVEGNDSDEDSGNIQKALQREEEEKQVVQDPKVKSSAILKSVFGEDAEDAVSLEGDAMSAEAISEEMVEDEAVSEVEETYTVGDDYEKKGRPAARDSSPFQIAKDFNDENEEEKNIQQPMQKKTDEQIMSEMTKGAMDADKLNATSEPEVADKLGQVLEDLKLEAIKNGPGFGDEAPQSQRLQSIQLPGQKQPEDKDEPEQLEMGKKLSSIQLPEKQPIEMKDQEDEDADESAIPTAPRQSSVSFELINDEPVQEEPKAMVEQKDKEASSSSESDSDFDIFEALDSSQELQTCLRQYIRNELQSMGPKILAKVQSELNLSSQSEIPLRGPEENSNKVVVEDEPQEEAKNGVPQEESKNEVPQALPGLLKKVPSYSAEMHGGWDTKHIHSQLAESEVPIENAPDKGEANDFAVLIEKKNVVENCIEEPVIVDQVDSEAVIRDRQVAESYINIRLNAKLQQDAVQPVSKKAEPERAVQKKNSLFKSIFQEVKSMAKGLIELPAREETESQITLADGPDFAEVYTEVSRTEGTKANARVVWKLRNTSEYYKWHAGMQIVPCCSFPTLRIHYESSICQLESLKNGTLKLNVQIPADFKANHLVLLFKMRNQKGNWVGPNLLLFVKVINQKPSGQEISSFDLSNGSDDHNGRSSELVRQDQIERGIDVYSEQQLLNMGSILADEGFGSFDRCMMVLRTLRGDIENSRKLLSSLTFAEIQIA